MILKYRFKDLDYTSQLTEYQQAVMDIAAYNSALLHLKSPTQAGVTGENGKKADQCYQTILQNAQNWMQNISVHCRVIPETIASYDFLFQSEIETIKQGLGVLIDAPNNDATKDSVASTIACMNQIMSSYVTDIQNLIDEIDRYEAGNQAAVESFQTILDDIVQDLQQDQTSVTRIRSIIEEAQKTLYEESQRLKADETLLKNPLFIIISLFAAGIPLIAYGIDAKIAESQIKAQKLLIQTKMAELQHLNDTIISLTAAHTAYLQVQKQITSLLSSSKVILDIWNKLSDSAGSFASFLQDESKKLDSSGYRSALSEIDDMAKSWQSLSQFSSLLSNVHYEITVETDAVA